MRFHSSFTSTFALSCFLLAYLSNFKISAQLTLNDWNIALGDAEEITPAFGVYLYTENITVDVPLLISRSRQFEINIFEKDCETSLYPSVANITYPLANRFNDTFDFVAASVTIDAREMDESMFTMIEGEESQAEMWLCIRVDLMISQDLVKDGTDYESVTFKNFGVTAKFDLVTRFTTGAELLSAEDVDGSSPFNPPKGPQPGDGIVTELCTCTDDEVPACIGGASANTASNGAPTNICIFMLNEEERRLSSVSNMNDRRLLDVSLDKFKDLTITKGGITYAALTDGEPQSNMVVVSPPNDFFLKVRLQIPAYFYINDGGSDGARVTGWFLYKFGYSSNASEQNRRFLQDETAGSIDMDIRLLSSSSVVLKGLVGTILSSLVSTTFLLL